MKQNISRPNASRYLTFSLGKEEFAMPLLQVKEVIALPEVTPVPQTPNYFKGIMNLRGQVISILDLRTKLGITAVQTEETAVIICDISPYCVGIIVDAVNSVIAATDEEIAPKPDLTSQRSEAISGVYQRKNSLVLLLDIGKTLNLTDQVIVKQANKLAA